MSIPKGFTEYLKRKLEERNQNNASPAASPSGFVIGSQVVEDTQDSDYRNKAMESILTGLQTEGAGVTTVKQIQDKITNLRNYYAAERRKIEASQKSGAGTANVYISSWKFYAQLQFLQDALIPRDTASSIDSREENLTESATVALNKLAARQQLPKQSEPVGSPEDRCLSEMILQMLSNIPDSEAKALAKLEFQQKLIQLRYHQCQQSQPVYQMPFVMPQERYYTAQLQDAGELDEQFGASTPSSSAEGNHSNIY
eukprot:gene11516-biopygen9186